MWREVNWEGKGHGKGRRNGDYEKREKRRLRGSGRYRPIRLSIPGNLLYPSPPLSAGQAICSELRQHQTILKALAYLCLINSAVYIKSYYAQIMENIN